ncbi:hypothetical protein ACIQF6_28360 [Kitasatospora sp. NPDC092948]|uniref:hypothetical protein n=1 Tax=Kitasatospora sp. NPDC092948 TaxID=3364088 RepID=UPI0037F660E9
MTTPAPRQPGPDNPESVPEWPLPVATLARHLHVNRSTLHRALANDPTAPTPVEQPDNGRDLYYYRAVHAWWPNRRSRGERGPDQQPRAPYSRKDSTSGT